MQRHLAQLNALTARSRPSALGWVLLALLALAAAPAAWAQVQLPAPPSSPAPVQRLEYDPNGNLTRHVQQQAIAGAGLATYVFTGYARLQALANRDSSATSLEFFIASY